MENKYKCKLGDIASFNFGYYGKATENDGVAYLHVRNFSENGDFLYNVENYISLSNVKKEMLLKQDDIIFVSKGMKFFAHKYDEDLGPSVASSIFYVIKVNTVVVLPDYLTCILSHPKSLIYFNSVSAGSSIPSIRKKELLDFEINIPSIEIQKKIVEINNLHKKQIAILEQLKQNKQILFNQLINKLNK